MSLVVNTNIGSQIAQRYLYSNSSNLNTAMQRLSSGLRINSAADDAACLALSESISSHVSGSEIAKTNALTGINMLQTAESDLSVIQQNLQRMRDLSVQASNGVYSDSEREMMNTEFQQNKQEIDRIAASSKFAGLNLLDGTATDVTLQVGTDNDANDQIDITSLFDDASTAGDLSGISAATITTLATAQSAMASLSAAITTISNSRSLMGASINRLQGTIKRVDSRKENLAAATSVLRDADIAKESASLTRLQILQQATTSMLAQANQSPQLALRLLQ